MSALACVRVRFQRHDVLPYAFCFNFLEATSSISFPLLLFFFPSFFTLFGSPSRSCVPLSPVAASATALPRGSSAKCTTVVFSTVDAVLGIYPHPPLSLPTLTHSRLFSILPRQVRRPHRALTRSFPSFPFIPSLRHTLSLSRRHPSDGVKG